MPLLAFYAALKFPLLSLPILSYSSLIDASGIVLLVSITPDFGTVGDLFEFTVFSYLLFWLSALLGCSLELILGYKSLVLTARSLNEFN